MWPTSVIAWESTRNFPVMTTGCTDLRAAPRSDGGPSPRARAGRAYRRPLRPLASRRARALQGALTQPRGHEQGGGRGRGHEEQRGPGEGPLGPRLAGEERGGYADDRAEVVVGQRRRLKSHERPQREVLAAERRRRERVVDH